MKSMYKNISKNRTSPRGHVIDRITPHCIVGQWTAKQAADYFATTTRQASSNYCIGRDGEVSISVPEIDRAWTSSSRENDNRAVTIECASEKSSPFRMNKIVFESLINLCIDICKRHGKTRLIWIPDKNKALSYKPQSNEMLITVHRWFASTACPGDWLYDRLHILAAEVTKRLGGLQEGQEGMVKITADGKYFTVRGKLIENTNYVSIRDVAENLGYKVDWNNVTKEVVLSRGV